MMDAFAQALAYVLRNEGTTFTDAPGDAGGPTRYGITCATLSEYRGAPCTADDVRNLAMPEVTEIYRLRYWSPMHLGEVTSGPVATAAFDVSVLCGIRAAAKMLQGAVGATQDGSIGPKTLAAVNAAPPRQVILALHAELVAYLTALTKRVPAQRQWLTGWLMRSARMLLLPVANAPPVA